MKKRLTALIIGIAMLLSLSACGEPEKADDETSAAITTISAESAETLEQTNTADENGVSVGAEANNTAESSAFALGAAAAEKSTGVSSEVAFSDGLLSVNRAERETETPMGADGTWTVFCYFCGTDLETGGGAASADIDEMLAASASDNVKFVVETGGTTDWQNENAADGMLTRMVISGGKLSVLGTAKPSSMGDSATLQGFLEWGIENYAAANMGLILWNHGSGSIGGVCFDELNDSDSLSLTEIDNALTGVYGKMTEKFEFIGFDACLMATLETANVLVPHAKYMIASEETESGLGWEYTSIMSYLESNPEADGLALGTAICDSFFAANAVYGLDNMSTLSVTDLSEVDAVIDAFNTAAADIYALLDDSARLAEFCRVSMTVENYGGNNASEGYTDMADLGDLAVKCSSIISNSDEIVSALSDAVPYMVKGSNRASGHGLSFFFPYAYTAEYMSTLKTISVSPYYMAFCDKFSYMSSNGTGNGYNPDQWLSDSGYWGTDEIAEDEDDYDYWNDDAGSYYVSENNVGTLTFDTLPYIGDDGYFRFAFSPDSMDYVQSVQCSVSQWIDDDEVILGTDNDITVDWIGGEVSDNFQGVWLSLPDGQNLCLTIVEEGTDYDIYSAPVMLNDKFTFLRIVWDYTVNSIKIVGTWDGVSSTGASPRMGESVKAGDVIVPIYNAYDENDDYTYYYGNEYVYDGESEIQYSYLDDGVYAYSFNIIDIYGNTYLTDYVNFTVDENGDVYYS